MSKDSATVIKDGQLAVATVPQTGTLVGAASEIDATALVETADGLQLCVKTCEVGGGGGGGGTVDQTYDPTSTNAQSGTAVAEAVQPALKNTATDANSLTILGTPTTTYNAIVIGQNSSVSNNYSTVIGQNSQARGCGGVSIGQHIYNIGHGAVAIGRGVSFEGSSSNTQGSIAIGGAGNDSTIPISTDKAKISNASYAIQLGRGTNSTSNSFQVFSYQMLDGNTGKIPMARLPIVQLTQADYDALVSGGTVDANTIYCIIPA